MDIYFAGELSFQAALVPFPVALTLALHLVFGLFFFIFPEPGFAVPGFSQNCGISPWLLWSVSFRLDWSCKQQVLCQAASRPHSSACLNSCCFADLSEGWQSCTSARWLHRISLFFKGLLLVPLPCTLGRELQSSSVLCATLYK